MRGAFLAHAADRAGEKGLTGCLPSAVRLAAFFCREQEKIRKNLTIIKNGNNAIVTVDNLSKTINVSWLSAASKISLLVDGWNYSILNLKDVKVILI